MHYDHDLPHYDDIIHEKIKDDLFFLMQFECFILLLMDPFFQNDVLVNDVDVMLKDLYQRKFILLVFHSEMHYFRL